MKDSLDAHLLEVERLLEAKPELTAEEARLLEDIRTMRHDDMPQAFNEDGEPKTEELGPLTSKLEKLLHNIAADHPDTVQKINAILIGLSRTGI